MATQQLMTNQEVQKMLNVTNRTLYKYRKECGLPYFKLNNQTLRYDRDKVLEWVAQNRPDIETQGKA